MTFDEELIIILKEELKVLEELVKLSFAKTNAIMEENLEGLTGITKNEERLINRVGTLEENRIRHLDNWGVAIDTPISVVINRLPEENEKLIELKDELYKVMNNLDSQNQVNNKLINQNLEWIDFNINLMSSAQTPTGYGQNEDEKGSGDSTMFDRKV